MKRVVKEEHFLHILEKCNCKLNKAILRNCDDHLIKTLCEIIYNIMKGNVQLTPEQKSKLKKYKKPLRLIYHAILKKKSAKKRRSVLVNQTGGFIGTIASLILSTLASKLVDYAVDKFSGNSGSNNNSHADGNTSNKT